MPWYCVGLFVVLESCIVATRGRGAASSSFAVVLLLSIGALAITIHASLALKYLYFAISVNAVTRVFETLVEVSWTFALFVFDAILVMPISIIVV